MDSPGTPQVALQWEQWLWKACVCSLHCNSQRIFLRISQGLVSELPTHQPMTDSTTPIRIATSAQGDFSYKLWFQKQLSDGPLIWGSHGVETGFETPCAPLDRDICNPVPRRPKKIKQAWMWHQLSHINQQFHALSSTSFSELSYYCGLTVGRRILLTLTPWCILALWIDGISFVVQKYP